jgi:uncharacterized membrane protein
MTYMTAPPFNPRTNSLAVAALVFGFVFPLLAIPLGHMARRQIVQTGERGDGMAVIGLVLGYLALTAIVVAMVVVIVIIAAKTGG